MPIFNTGFRVNSGPPQLAWDGSGADNATPRSTAAGEGTNWSGQSNNPFTGFGFSFDRPSYRERTGAEVSSRAMFPGPSTTYYQQHKGDLNHQGMFEANVPMLSAGMLAPGMQQQVANRALNEYDKYMQPMDQSALDAAYQHMLDKTGASMTSGAAARGMLGSSVAESARSNAMGDLAAQRAIWNEEMALKRANTARDFLMGTSNILGTADQFKRGGYENAADILNTGQGLHQGRIGLGSALAQNAGNEFIDRGNLAITGATSADQGGLDRTKSGFDMAMTQADREAQQQAQQFGIIKDIYNLLGGNIDTSTDAGTANAASAQADQDQWRQDFAKVLNAIAKKYGMDAGTGSGNAGGG